MVKVVTDFFNSHRKGYAVLHIAVPLRQVKYKLVGRHLSGGTKKVLLNGFKDQNLEALYLSAPRRGFVAISLQLQGEDWQDYIEPVTIHSEWKIQMHQGYIFVVKGSEQSVCLGAAFPSRRTDVTAYIKKALALDTSK